MANNFKLVLDTTAPLGPQLTINGGLPVANERTVPVQFTTADTEPIVGYQVKIWGDVDPTDNPDIQLTEGESGWINWTGEEANTFLGAMLSEGDGIKVLHGRIRDDVWNETTELTAEVELNTSIPIITITAGPTRSKISEVEGRDQTSFTFKANETLRGWVVEVMASEGDAHGTGHLIEEVEGSENTDEQTTELAGETNQTVMIDGSDLENAVGADGEYIIKVFGQGKASTLWSS
jgi:hypothetical protein